LLHRYKNRDNQNMANESLILTGFMCMGKSTVGPRVADALGVAYADTDEWMESIAGIDIPQLVRTDMHEFRKAEAAALAAILEQEPGVVSTGGGIVSTEIGRAALGEAAAKVVWLRAPFEVAAGRVLDDAGRERPLFDSVATARGLFEERQQWYEETADFIIDASLSRDDVVRNVLSVVSL
jgi:shikimate kinase